MSNKEEIVARINEDIAKTKVLTGFNEHLVDIYNILVKRIPKFEEKDRASVIEEVYRVLAGEHDPFIKAARDHFNLVKEPRTEFKAWIREGNDGKTELWKYIKPTPNSSSPMAIAEIYHQYLIKAEASAISVPESVEMIDGLGKYIKYFVHDDAPYIDGSLSATQMAKEKELHHTRPCLDGEGRGIVIDLRRGFLNEESKSQKETRDKTKKESTIREDSDKKPRVGDVYMPEGMEPKPQRKPEKMEGDEILSLFLNDMRDALVGAVGGLPQGNIAIQKLKNMDTKAIRDAVVGTANLGKVAYLTENANSKIGNESEFVECPDVGDKDLPGKVRKEIITACGSNSYSDSSKPNKTPLRTILQTAKGLIEEHKLSSEAGYSLLRPCLDGGALTFLSTQEQTCVPFRSMWYAIQSLNKKKVDPKTVLQKIYNIKSNPCHDVAAALVSLHRLHSQLYKDEDDRERLVHKSARSDAIHVIRENLPSCFHRIMESERALKDAYDAEVRELDRRGLEVKSSVLKTEYHPFNTLLSLVSEETNNVCENRGRDRRGRDGHVYEVAALGEVAELGYDGGPNESGGNGQGFGNQPQQNRNYGGNFNGKPFNRNAGGQDTRSRRGGYGNYNRGRGMNRGPNYAGGFNRGWNNNRNQVNNQGGQQMRNGNPGFNRGNDRRPQNDARKKDMIWGNNKNRYGGNNVDRNRGYDKTEPRPVCKNCLGAHKTIDCTKYKSKPGTQECPKCYGKHTEPCVGPNRCEWNNYTKPQ